MKKIQVENEKVEIKIDFKMVWAFMWRWVVLVFGIAFCLGVITTIFGQFIGQALTSLQTLT